MDIPSDTLAASETMESKIEKCMDIGSAFERPFWTDKSTVPYPTLRGFVIKRIKSKI